MGLLIVPVIIMLGVLLLIDLIIVLFLVFKKNIRYILFPIVYIVSFFSIITFQILNGLLCQTGQKGMCLIGTPNKMFDFTFIYVIISLFLGYSIYILIKKTFYTKKTKYKAISILILLISIYFIITTIINLINFF